MTVKWWKKYTKTSGDKVVLMGIAREYWELYTNLVETADAKLCANWSHKAKDRSKALSDWDEAMLLAQPLLEEYVEICQELNQVVL